MLIEVIEAVEKCAVETSLTCAFPDGSLVPQKLLIVVFFDAENGSSMSATIGAKAEAVAFAPVANPREP